MSTFIGRNNELARLTKLIELQIPHLLVLKGRRRIGKSRLLREFGKQFSTVYSFSGLPPEESISAPEQREEFARQLERQCQIPEIKTDNWSDLFWHLSQQTTQGRILVILDEITWMAMDDKTFLPKLKNAWDLYFSQNNQIVVALCGSISAWIEKNILSSTGFMGRNSLSMTLKELPIEDCGKFWQHSGKGVSPQEQLIMLAVTGGVPRYLEAMNPKYPAEQNIKELCFTQEGILFSEFDKIFSDLFSKRSAIYKQIVRCLTNAKLDVGQLCKALNRQRNKEMYEYLDDLKQAGFISQDYTWHIKDGRLSKLNEYRLADNYSRFYLRYIEPNKEKIIHNDIEGLSPMALPGWSSIIGLQIENLVLRNRHLIKKVLGLTANEIICDNPYFQRKTAKQAGCQIDYLIQTTFNTLYVCEIKYSKQPIHTNVIEEMQNKIDRLTKPKNFSYRPVLIHCNAVDDVVEESGFFSNIINFSEFI